MFKMSARRYVFISACGLVTMTCAWWVVQRASAPVAADTAVAETATPLLAMASGVADPTPPPTASSFIARFDQLVARGQVAQAVRSALVLLRERHPSALPLDERQREALQQRLVHLLPHFDQRLAVEVLRALCQMPLNDAGRQAVLASALRLPPSRERTAILRQQLETTLPAAALTPALADPDPRIRAAAAKALRQHGAVGDQVAQTALAQAAAQEVDPRVRQALASNTETPTPTFGEDRKRPLELPPAAARAPTRTLETIWDSTGNGGAQKYLCHSTITIDPEGRAKVETVREGDGEKWHIRYDAWAWVDDKGTVIIDGRGQPVQEITIPPWGDWSPDSMQIAPDGTTTTIDDRHSAEAGETAMPCSG